MAIEVTANQVLAQDSAREKVQAKRDAAQAERAHSLALDFDRQVDNRTDFNRQQLQDSIKSHDEQARVRAAALEARLNRLAIDRAHERAGADEANLPRGSLVDLQA